MSELCKSDDLSGVRCHPDRQRYKQLIKDGFCVVPKLLDVSLLERLRIVSDGLLDAQDSAALTAQLSTGSMVSVTEHPLFAELIVYPPALSVLCGFGAVHPRWSSGYIISKPPNSPALFWHQDWWGWNDATSYTPLPQQLFLMYYLIDTTPENGCLRLLRGSHLRRHKMHDLVPDAHTEELRRMSDPNHPAYQVVEEEVDVPVKAGDLVIGDSRLLHAAHANCSDARRTVITLWYQPFFDLLSEELQAAIGKPRVQDDWSSEAWSRVEEAGLIPVYSGDVEPTEWNRIPGPQLLP